MREVQNGPPVSDKPVTHEPNTTRFYANFESLAETYRQAYAGFPWFEKDTVTLEVSKDRLRAIAALPGFEAFVVEDSAGHAIAAELFDTPTIAELSKRKGDALGCFAQKVCSEEGITSIVWENELFVHPDYQRQGIAGDIRKIFIAYLSEKYSDGVLVLSRLRDDNTGTVKSAENVGFQRTGVRVRAGQQPEAWHGQLHHEFWYKIIRPTSLSVLQTGKQ